MATQSHILVFDLDATGAGDGLVGGIGPDGKSGIGSFGPGAGGVCVGGCGLVWGSIEYKSPLFVALL